MMVIYSWKAGVLNLFNSLFGKDLPSALFCCIKNGLFQYLYFKKD